MNNSSGDNKLNKVLKPTEIKAGKPKGQLPSASTKPSPKPDTETK